MQRIDKFLSTQGVCSRRECDKLIRGGLVTQNGSRVKSGADKCQPDTDVICVAGKQVVYRAFVYYLMNKPAGVLTATADKKAKTVMDLLPPHLAVRRDVAPAGRLDKDTTGLLLLTDDGDFAHRLISPSCKVPKTYRVTVDVPIPPETEQRFAKGVYIEGGHLTAPAKIRRLSNKECFLTITEGKYHQVKQMMKKVGCTVTALHRVSIGRLSLPESLSLGETMELTPETAALLLQGEDG